MVEKNSDEALTVEQQDWVRFLTSDGLAEKAGCPPSDFDKMVIKEFADNAADIGGFGYKIDEEERAISIWNAGNGLSREDIARLFDIKRPLRSSKHWRRGQRGALGNGIRVALAGCRLCNIDLSIISRRQQYNIKLLDNGDTVITTQDTSVVDSGTRILLNFPDSKMFSKGRYLSFLNVALMTQGSTVISGKPLASWFKAEDINVLIQSLPNMSLGEFIGQFSNKGDLDINNFEASVQDLPTATLVDLLRANEGQSKVNPIGKDVFEGFYKKIEGVYHDGDARLPFIIEAWAKAERSEKDAGDHIIHLITNRTYTLRQAVLEVNSGRVKIIAGGYYRTHNKQINRNHSYRVILSVSSPYIPIISSGKEPNLLDGDYSAAIMDALQFTMKQAGAANPTRRKSSFTLIDAANMCMEDAYNKVSNNGQYWANARQLMYAARPKMLEITGQSSFTDSYFSQTLLPHFLQNNPELTANWKVAYDKRGSVIQPHTGQSVGLGTVEIDRLTNHVALKPMSKLSSFKYSNASPERRFSAVLFVEKEGFNEAIEESGLLERYDIALASTKGNSVVALRVLLDEMVTRNPDFKVFTMTDFDISGTSIKTTLTKDNELRYTFKNDIQTIPVCVTWEQAKELHERGLSEPVEFPKPPKKTAKEIAKALDAKFQFLVRENDVEPDGARFLMYRKRRVEINAMTTGEILDLIERAFEEHATKVLPDRLHLEGAWKEQLLSAHLEKVEAEMRDELISHEMPENLMEDVEAILKENPSKSWDQAVREVAGRTLV